MMRFVTLSAAALCCVAFLPGIASACEGNDVIFEDNFANDSGGWALHPAIEVKDGNFIIKLKPDDLQTDLNITFTVDDADVCSEAVWPDGDQKILGAGLLFWGEDSKDFFQFGILNNGKYWIARKQDGKWHTIVENVESSAIKTDAGAANQLRVKVDGRHGVLLHQRHQGARSARPAAQRRLALRPLRRQFRQGQGRGDSLPQGEGHQLALRRWP